MDINSAILETRKSHVRYYILFMLFFVTSINYADRSILSISGTDISKNLGIDSVTMGYIFSAFGWAYIIGQIPGGRLLDLFGSKMVYSLMILTYSLLSLLHGVIDYFSTATAVVLLFVLRFLVGLIAAPIFPANARIVSEWFPSIERGTATATFTSAQYFSTVLFAPLIGWITFAYGWKFVFVFMGLISILVFFVWSKMMHSPGNHPHINHAEFVYIKQGGALINMDHRDGISQTSMNAHRSYTKDMLKKRMLWGIYIAQYCSTTLTYFFLTWFPVYLVKELGMSILQVSFIAILPAFCGFIGAISGGLFSDYLLKRSSSLTFARKTPIIIGMLISMSLVTAINIHSEWLIVFVMAFSYFGKGFGGLGWAIISDTSPKEISGINGALFNTFGNFSGITSPIIIGYILQYSGSFNGALLFVGANALLAIICYVFVVGEIKRIDLKV